MSIETLYADGIEAGIQRQIANPAPEPGTSFSTRSFLAAGMRGVPAAGLQVGGSVMDVLRGAQIESLRHPKPAVLGDQPDDSARRSGDLQTFGIGGEPLREKAAEFAPDPTTAHAADQVLYGFTRVGTKVAAATIAAPTLPIAALLLGAEGTNTAYHELRAKGIDHATALKAAGIEGAGQAAAVIPMAGPTLAKTSALTVAAGPGTFMAQEKLSHEILARAGYNDEASRHDPLDPLGLTIATLIPAVFGGAHAARLPRSSKPAPTLASVVEGIESGGRRFGADGQLLTSPKGAQGEMQVMPMTATDPGFGVVPAKDASPEELARVGRDYLDAMQHRYGSPDLAMAAYNVGPGAVDKALNAHGADWLAHLPGETQAYVAKGMKKLGTETAAHAATDPAAVDAARTRVTQDALHRTLPDSPEAFGTVMRASDEIAAGRMPDVKPIGEDYSAFFGDMQPKYDVPPESRGTLRSNELGQPEIRTSRIALTDGHPVERFEAILEPGEQMTRFAIRSPEGKVMGYTDLLLKDGQVVSLYDIETTPGLRGQGVGGKVVEAITSLDPDRKLGISNIVDDAVPFWEKVGVQVNDGNRSPTLDWHQFAESSAGRDRGAPRRSAQLAGDARRSDAGAAGSDATSPRGGDARELTPEEAAQFGFHSDSAPPNALPPTDQVALAPEAPAKAPEPRAPAERVAQIVKDAPDLQVQLPGSDKTLSVAEALKLAKEEHAAELSENDLVRAALECALGFGG